MPETDVVFYAEADGSSPARDWLLREVSDEARDKLFYRVLRLEAEGYQLRRPEAAPLRNGVYELRVRHRRVNYRLLYFFHKGVGVIAHGCTKEGKVGEADIDRVTTRIAAYVINPRRHTFVKPAGH